MKESRIGTFVGFLFILLVCFVVLVQYSVIVAGAFLLLSLILFVYNGIDIIPQVHKAVLVCLGRRTNILLDEGMCFLPLSPLLFSKREVFVEKVNREIPPQKMRVVDKAEVLLWISFTWSPAYSSSPQGILYLNKYIEGGERRGVEKIIQDLILDRVRLWALSDKEGPSSWLEVLGAKDEAVAEVLSAVLGEELEEVPSHIETSTLLRYFSGNPPLILEREKWGKGWEKLKEELSRLSPTEVGNLKRVLKERKRMARKVLQGNGDFVHREYGVVIHKIAIIDAAPTGKVAKAAEREIEEGLRALAHQVEADKYATIMKKYKGEGLSAKDAMRAAMIVTGKLDPSSYRNWDIDLPGGVEALLNFLQKQK